MTTDKRYYDNTSSTWKRLYKIDEECHLFEELPASETKNESFTMSYAVAGESWVFFHDYFPNFYFHTRENLFSTWANQLYKHNSGDYGKYYDDSNYGVVKAEGTIIEGDTEMFGPTDPVDPLEPKDIPLGLTHQTVYPFFIDVVFRTDADILLETVNWISTVLDRRADERDIDDQWNTLTHISIWNSQQHTGRIALEKIFDKLQYKTNRKTQGVWSFNDFRNIVDGYGQQFLQDIFNNYSLDDTTTIEKAWYEKELLQDKYMIVRFEFDNSVQKQLVLHDTTIKATKQIR